MDVITISSGSDENDSDVEIISHYTENRKDAYPFIKEQSLDVKAAPPDLRESTRTRRCKKKSSIYAIKLFDLTNDQNIKRIKTNHKTETLQHNGGDRDSNMLVNMPKSPFCLTEESKDLSRCVRQMEDICQAPACPIPQSSIISNNRVQLKQLVNTVFGQEENNEEKDNAESVKDDQLPITINSPPGSVRDTVEISHNAQEWVLEKYHKINLWSSSDSNHSESESELRPLSKQCSPCLTSQSDDLTDRLDLNFSSHQSTALKYPGSPDLSELFHDVKSQASLPLISLDTPHSENTVTETSEVEDYLGSSPACLYNRIPLESPLSVPRNEDFYLPDTGTEAYSGEQDMDSPVLFDWLDLSDGEEMCGEGNLGSGSREDGCFVCPVRLRKLMAEAAPHQDRDEEEGRFGVPVELQQQSLSLVYSTMEENHPEGTLQLLSDLLQPGFYPPRDITTHLLRGILLEPRYPQHLGVQAFNLLMRTQRHVRADKTTIPWDWELLTSVMDTQDHAKRTTPKGVVRMLLEYVVLTIEDDFRATLSPSTLHQTIAKATLSCNSQFTKVRDVIKWLCSAIMKSTEDGDGSEAARESDDHIRIVFILQRMLCVALEVDCSPTLSSMKLSLELFHMLLLVVPLRAHRKLLLDSLQSKLLKCKLLQHLLEHWCPEKTHLPMSLNLLLYFLKNCTLGQEPTDSPERWPKWDELTQLLWMLLLSYDAVIKGHLSRPITGRVAGAAITTANDVVSAPAVLDAVECFLSRSQADVGHTLPDHIEESLSYLQEHLLDVCQPLEKANSTVTPDTN